MLPYMQEKKLDDKPPPGPCKLALELIPPPEAPEPPLRDPRTNISKESSTSSFASDVTSSSTPTGASDKPRKHKLLNGGKHASMKRVSFGSSKGSMVETLVYESPLQEEADSTTNTPPPQETSFPYPISEDESERSKVRVSFYQGAKPQCLSPPPPRLPPSALDPVEYGNPDVVYALLLTAASLYAGDKAAMGDQPGLNRQVSTESGWDNPFRPDGDLSREADEIVSLIKGGKPITPTPAALPQLPVCEELDEKYVSGALASPQQSPQTKAATPQSTPKANGTKNGSVAPRGPVDVQRSPPQEPQQPEHVTIKKKPKCECCSVQ